MIRLYEYIQNEPDNPVYRDFQNFLFSQPYDFIWDFPADKVTIHGTAYRISSRQFISDSSSGTVIIGGGNTGSDVGGGDCKCPETPEGYGNIYAGGMFENRPPVSEEELTALTLVYGTNPIARNVLRGDVCTFKIPAGTQRAYIATPAALKGITRMFDGQTLDDLPLKELLTITIDEIEYELFYIQFLQPASGEKTIIVTI